MSSVSIQSKSVSLSVSRDAGLKAILLAVTLLADAILIFCLDLTFPPGDLVQPLLVATVLSGTGLWYLRRGEDGFVMCMLALTHLVLYTAAYSVLMYAIAATNMPLVDSQLIAFDHACGIHVAAVKAWAEQHPLIGAPLAIAYDTVMLQTAIVVIVLGFTRQRRDLENFVLLFMITTLICAACFFFLPAEAAAETHSYSASDAQQRFIRDFHAMRSHQRHVVTWRDAEGLITCPSFHTTWAILLAWALRKQKYWRLPMLILNLAVIASTMTLGWHYFADVVAGILLAVVGIVFVSRLQPWLYDELERPRTAPLW